MYIEEAKCDCLHNVQTQPFPESDVVAELSQQRPCPVLWSDIRELKEVKRVKYQQLTLLFALVQHKLLPPNTCLLIRMISRLTYCTCLIS